MFFETPPSKRSLLASPLANCSRRSKGQYEISDAENFVGHENFDFPKIVPEKSENVFIMLEQCEIDSTTSQNSAKIRWARWTLSHSLTSLLSRGCREMLPKGSTKTGQEVTQGPKSWQMPPRVSFEV